MFTGIVEGTGKVLSYKKVKKGGLFVVESSIPTKSMKIGDSLAVDGCCLTVIEKKGKNLSFDISDETIRKTAIGQYKKQTIVNLERPMKASDRFGGHFVMGHVDGLGQIKSIKDTQGSIEMKVQFPKQLSRYIIEKGSITIDGISLTACNVKATSLDVYLIPHTMKLTNLHAKNVGSAVNLEVDVLGKYVEKQMHK